MNSLDRAFVRERFLKVDTSNIADVLDEMGFPDQGLSPDFCPFPATSTKLAGFAYTIRGQMTPYKLGGDQQKMEACSGIGPEEISVWGGDGEGICYFGELIAVGMKEKGCAGALVDGGVRDIRWLKHHDFSVFARYRTPVQSISRWKVNGWQIPISVAGATTKYVTITPGDFIAGDDDGVIAVPSDKIMTVLERAEQLTKKEIQIRRELINGLSLADALAKFGHV